jgi:hypothetical protein
MINITVVIVISLWIMSDAMIKIAKIKYKAKKEEK